MTDRDKIIEVMARAIAPKAWKTLGHPPGYDTPANKNRRTASLRHAEGALGAYESHLQASGMAVVPGWQPIETAPAWSGAEAAKVLVIGGRFPEPTLTFPDGEYWRANKHSMSRVIPVMWMPVPPASPYGKAVVQDEMGAEGEARSTHKHTQEKDA